MLFLFPFVLFHLAGATSVTAIVAESDSSDRVQVELNQRRDVDIWIYQKNTDRWHSPDFTLSNFYFANGTVVVFDLLLIQTELNIKK